MNIVVTDGYTLNPGDLSWDKLEALGSCRIYDNSTCEENLKRCKGAEIAVTNKVRFDEKAISQLPDLKFISVTATGYDIIDIAAAKDAGIVVSNVPSYASESVAQMTFALLLELTQNVGDHSKTVHEGKWSKCGHFCYWDSPLIELSGLTMGLIGYGSIGKSVARIALAFGMNVLAYDPVAEIRDVNVKSVELEKLLAQSDVVSLHCPLTNDNKGMINKARIALMKSNALVVNTSRGALINETDLAEALNDNRIAGAALDVLAKEPPRDNCLLKARHCFVTPHISWATRSARSRLMNTTIENISAYLDGQPINVVI
jgi:glycerate dehydrogenase